MSECVQVCVAGEELRVVPHKYFVVQRTSHCIALSVKSKYSGLAQNVYIYVPTYSYFIHLHTLCNTL